MNFILFVLATVLFMWFFWWVLSTIIFLPSVPMLGLISYLSENPEKKWTKIALVPAFVTAFIFGTLLPCGVFGAGMGLIALNFTEKATHPLIYFLLAGFGAFTICAPSGETSFHGMLISLGSYVITVMIPKFALFSGITITFLASLFWWGIGLLILVGIVFLIVEFLDNKISKRNKPEAELQQKVDTKLSIGVRIFCIFFMILGGLWVISFLLQPSSFSYFIEGVLYLIGSIGMLKRKYWALRLSQVGFVLGTLLGLVIISVTLFKAEKLDLFGVLIALFLLFIFGMLPLWFLFKKSTVDQFK